MNCVFKDITTIGDLRTEYEFIDKNNDIKDNIDLLSTLDIIERYPSYQCASFTKILNLMYPESQNCFFKTELLFVFRSFIPNLTCEQSIPL